MSLNKKQKKQLEIARKKLTKLRQQLAGAKRQLDDLDEVTRLEQQIALIEEQVKKIQSD